jgi:hypothetical protein
MTSLGRPSAAWKSRFGDGGFERRTFEDEPRLDPITEAVKTRRREEFGVQRATNGDRGVTRARHGGRDANTTTLRSLYDRLGGHNVVPAGYHRRHGVGANRWRPPWPLGVPE